MAVFKTISFTDFSGGLNLRDGLSELQLNETPDCWNVTINQRGGVQKRLGYQKWNTSGLVTGDIDIGHNSQAIGKLVWQAGDKLYTETGSGAFSASIKTFTTSARCAMVDFAGEVWITHPADGLFHYDGTTFSAAVTNGPASDTIAVWQNRIWIPEGNTLWFSDIGDGTTWPADNFNNIRVKDDTSIEAVFAGDREGLLVFKKESTYRVYDSNSGAYMTIDRSHGAVGHLAVTSAYSRVYVLNEEGMFSTDGLSALRDDSEKIKPLFSGTQLSYTNSDLWAVGTHGTKVLVSLVENGESANTLALEYDTRFNSWVAQSCAMACYVRYDADTTLGASPTVDGQVYELFTNIGTDDGTAITSRYQTASFRPEQLGKMRVREAIIRGRGAFTLQTKLDGTLGYDQSFPIDFTEDVMSWDSGYLWDDSASIWGPTADEGTDRIFSLGHCRDFSFEVSESSSEVGAAPPPLDTLTSYGRGFWALLSLKVYYVPLGLS